LIICGSLDTLTGGFLYDKFLVMHLRQNGHKIDIVSLPWRWYGQHLLDNFSPKLRSGLISKTYDLILQDELSHPSLFLLNHRLRKYRDVPLVSIVHQVLSCQPRRYWMNILFKTIEKIYLTSVDAFIFNSETTRGRVQHLINFEGPSIVANPGGDRLGHLQAAEQIKARATQRGPLELVFVGNITPVKRLISEKKIRQQVDLAGPLDGNELINILSKSHLFVMPFSHEGFGIAYLEALAYGLPVLASTAGAVKEYIQPGQNGFLQTPDNPGVLCKHINNLYRDRDELARMSSAALKTFHSRPNWKNTVESIHAFLEKLVA
jgi:glycosyltransferase involved in cell wall biosynthesis